MKMARGSKLGPVYLSTACINRSRDAGTVTGQVSTSIELKVVCLTLPRLLATASGLSCTGPDRQSQCWVNSYGTTRQNGQYPGKILCSISI